METYTKYVCHVIVLNSTSGHESDKRFTSRKLNYKLANWDTGL